MRCIFVPLATLLFIVHYGDACRDLISTCRRAPPFVCWHPLVGHTVRRNCAQRCRQKCSAQQKKVDHPSCRTWARQRHCKGRLATEMSVYCPHACSQNANHGKNTPRPVVNFSTTTTIPPRSNNPKLSLWAHSLNESTNVCGSFYDYTCGQYQAENRPTPRESFDRLTDHIKLVRERQQELIFDNSPTQSAAVQQMRQFRDKCMDETEVENLRTQRLISDIKSMGDLPMLVGQKWNAGGKFDLTQLLLKINDKSSQQFLFQLGVTEEKKSKKGGKTSLLFAGADLLIKHPDGYLDASKKDKIKALRYFLTDLVQILASDTRSQQTYAYISSEVNELVEFERKIAEIYVDLQLASSQQLEDALTQQRKVSDLSKLADSIQWSDYFAKNHIFSSPQLQQHLQSDPDVFVLTEDLITRLNRLITNTDKRTLANYLIVRFIVSRTAYLDTRFGDAARRFAQKLDGDARPRVRQDECVDSILVNFPLVVDYLYTAKYMDPKTEQSAKQLWNLLKQGAARLLSKQTWLSRISKQNAQKKLNNMQCTFGAVDSARDQQSLDKAMSGINLSGGYLQMAEQLQRASEQRKFEPLWSNSNGDLSLMRWRETRLSSGYIDAFLVKRQNRMFLPTAILHDPVFDPKLPHSVNLGAFGFVVAQIMMRGFDWKGAHFNDQGQKQSIWDKKTGKDFKKARDCLNDKYGSHAEPLTGINVDAKKTMRNNLADAAAVRVISEAYKLVASADKRVSGYEQYSGEQAMYISYGVTMCASLAKEAQAELLRTSPFSPNFFRVNIVLANFDEFQRVFRCGQGSRMIANPRCSTWEL